MNQMDETQLRGWQPRRASAGLKRRIFRATPAPAADWQWHPLAPALACLFFAVMLLHLNDGMPLRESEPLRFVNFAGVSNTTAFSDSAKETENHWSSVTFDWTNHSGFKSSIGSQIGPRPATNFSN